MLMYEWPFTTQSIHQSMLLIANLKIETIKCKSK
jgi:hypothetical protein